MGSVYRKYRSGRFVGLYAVFVDEGGRRRHVATKQSTMSAARIYLAEIEGRVRRGLVGVPELKRSPTLAELAARWLESRTGPKASVRQACGKVCLARLLPALGRMRAEEISRADVQRVLAGLRLAPNTLRATADTLGAVLGWAATEGLAEPSRALRGLVLPRREVAAEWLSAPEAAQLLDLAEQRSARSMRDGSRFTALSLALLCGLRRGEVFGLRWCDVDLETRRLRVARSYRGPTKTGRVRYAPISDELAPILRAWRSSCPQTSEGLVCPVLHHGRWGMSGPRVDHGIPRLLAAAGCKPLRRGWHGLRHTFASLFVQSGGDLFALSKLLGHADVRETQVYAHLSPDFLATARARLRLRG